MALSDNLISYWKLDEASGTRNDSVVASANNLTDNNTVTQAAGKISNAAQFTIANSEYLSCVSNASLVTGDIDFTVACWVYLDAKTTRQTFVSKSSGATPTTDEYYIDYSDATNRFRFVIGGTAYTVATADVLGSPTAATWYYIIAWHDSVANTINIQVNNGSANSLSTGIKFPPTTANVFTIGRYSADTPLYMGGRIDEVGFWKRVLTTQEKTDLYNSGNGYTYPFAATYTETGLITAISRASIADQLHFTETGLPRSVSVLDTVSQWQGIDLGQPTAIARANGGETMQMFDLGKTVAIWSAAAFDNNNVFLIMPTLLTLLNSGKTRITIHGS